MGNICNSQERDVQKDHSNQLQVIMILIYKWAKKKKRQITKSALKMANVYLKNCLKRVNKIKTIK